MGSIFKELRRNGIGKMLLCNAKRDNLGVAIHYSMSSIHASYIDDRHTSFDENRQGWIDILEDLGYQYDFIATQQIETGELEKGGFKFLVLPFSRAISQREEEQIRRFASRGGLVVADYQCGIMDESCGRLREGRLDDVFGIKRYSTLVHHFFCERGENLVDDFPFFDLDEINANINYQMPMHEPHIRLAGGKAALTQSLSSALPSVVVNNYGDGYGIYLNSSMNHYSKEREDGSYSRSREVMRHVMALNGIQKLFEVFDEEGNPVESGMERIYYCNGSERYVGLLRGLGKRLDVAVDGRQTGNVASLGGSNRYTVRLKEKRHLYDVRNATYLGHGTETEVEIGPGEAVILAALDSGPPSIRLDVPSSVLPGASFPVRGSAHIEGTSSRNLVWNIQIYQPDGTFDVALSRNFTGKALSCTVRIPFNAERGDWRIVLRDVATGASANKTVTVDAEE